MNSSTASTAKRKDPGPASLHPVAGPPMTKEQMEKCMIGLPPVMRGVGEVVVRMNLSERFVRTWLTGHGGIPEIPHSPMRDGSHIFLTAMVLDYLHQWHRPGTVEVLRGRRRTGDEMLAQQEQEEVWV